jgi:hypothetical protein
MREFDEADIQAIMGVVEELALDAADGDTSIPQEKLARILEAVRYCVDEGAACRGRADAEGLARCVGADELYRIGYRSIVDKTACALRCYNEMSPVFDDYGMEGLGRTFRDEIPAELSRFDPRFEPDAEVVFGYPMPQDDGTLLGIDAIAAAIDRIGFEQAALATMRAETVRTAAMKATRLSANLYEVLRVQES